MPVSVEQIIRLRGSDGHNQLRRDVLKNICHATLFKNLENIPLKQFILSKFMFALHKCVSFRKFNFSELSLLTVNA